MRHLLEDVERQCDNVRAELRGLDDVERMADRGDEHLEKLQNAGLVKRVDEGRKWIYYELSDKGRKILHPERVAITLALSAAVVLAMIGAAYVLLSMSAQMAAPARLANETAIPNALQSAATGLALVVLPFVLSAFCVVLALALRVFGQHRRERFFEQLGAA